MNRLVKIEHAIREHVRAGFTLASVGMLAARIEEALKPRLPAKEFVIGGLKCTRVIGAKLGRRKGAAKRYGWIITNLETGEEVRRLEPNHLAGVPEQAARLMAEQLVRIREQQKGG